MFVPSSSMRSSSSRRSTSMPRLVKMQTPKKLKSSRIHTLASKMRPHIDSKPLTKPALHAYMTTIEKNMLKAVGDIATKAEFNHYMRSLEKGILKQFDDLVTKDALHKYMQTVEKAILKGVHESLTKDDFNKYMNAVEKTLVNATKNGNEAILDSIAECDNKHAALTAEVHATKADILDAIAACDKKHRDLISDLHAEIRHLQDLKQRPAIVMTRKRSPYAARASYIATTGGPPIAMAEVVCGPGKKCPPGMNCNKRSKTCKRKS